MLSLLPLLYGEAICLAQDLDPPPNVGPIESVPIGTWCSVFQQNGKFCKDFFTKEECDNTCAETILFQSVYYTPDGEAYPILVTAMACADTGYVREPKDEAMHHCKPRQVQAGDDPLDYSGCREITFDCGFEWECGFGCKWELGSWSCQGTWNANPVHVETNELSLATAGDCLEMDPPQAL
ncbi:hypothetical protein Pla22_12540 [Rubripirellula amarantea]|uniref:Uncharacterized protein n=1 Tax=Rubripirellula amarantea TaxID=2527999 RepID=A0A5C5WRV3_9BACT|nr:hypothetical protein Pla22_12540 [Rubripirellula amarantea]